MAMRPPASTPDRHARLALAAAVATTLAVFVWLVVSLTDAALR